MRTRGEGVKNPENFADVLYVWSPLIEQAFVRTERDGEREGHFILMRNDIHDAHPMTSAGWD